MNPVLILGSSGKLGQILWRYWKDRPGLVWQARQPAAFSDILWSPGSDWTGPPRLRAVIALWGVVPGKGNLDDNRTLALQAAHLARQTGADRVIHCSSAAVYAPDPLPRSEKDTNPQNPYGQAKHAMEQALLADRAAHPGGPVHCALRIGNVAGADSLFASLDQPGPITMDQFPDGQGPRRSYLSHGTLVGALDALLGCDRAALPAVVNLADDGAMDMADLVRAAGRDFVFRTAGTGAIPALTLDITRLKLLFEPRRSTPEGLIADWENISESKA